MDPFTILTGIGLATQALGFFESNKAANTQQDISTQQSQLGQKAAGVRQDAANTQYKTDKALVKVSRQQERLRRTALNVDAARAQREVVRGAQAARAQAVASAANSGGLTSTGIQGVKAQINSDRFRQSATIYNNKQRGLQQFQLNSEVFSIQARNAAAQSKYGKNLASLETQNSELSVQSNNATSDSNFGKSLFSLGGSVVGSAEPASNSLMSLFGK